MLEIYWGGIALHRSKWGLGNTVLKTVATPEQFEKWKNHHDRDRDHRARCRLRPGEHPHDGDVRSRDRRMDSERRENFHLAGAVG